MINTYHIFNDIESLKNFLDSKEICSIADNASSILVQVYSAKTDTAWLKAIIDTIEYNLPSAIIVGATTVGEIVEGRLLTGKTVLSFTFFETSKLVPIVQSCKPETEYETGKSLNKAIHGIGVNIVGVLLLSTPLSIDTANLLKGLSSEENNYTIFGGGAGDYANLNCSFVFCGSEFLDEGAIAVVFSGKDLHIHSDTYLGWQPLSKEMIITEVDGMLVKTVDNVKAFDIYHRYLGIFGDDDFYLKVQDFPFLLERNGELIARTPIATDEQGAIRFAADLNVGEKVRIGYGNPATIIKDAKDTQKDMRDFKPEAIFLYTCGTRRFLMQDDVNLETEPFELIAPTTGFYTYGEFYGYGDDLYLLNSTMVVVGMREGDSSEVSKFDGCQQDVLNQEKTVKNEADHKYECHDPYANKHLLIISKLMHFISAVTSELEEANEKLKILSERDKLTQLYNRLKLDSILESEIHRVNRYNYNLSVIIADIDRFKKVNDVYGHNVGDEVLARTARILKDNIRRTDFIGRWGGEEFLVILPCTNLNQACIIAEKLRVAIEREEFPVVKHKTCSFGVASYLEGDNQKDLIKRADEALYEAKRSGRNRVKVSGLTS